MFNRRRELKVPPPPPVKTNMENADAVLRDHRNTIIKVKTILEQEVERIDRYLEGKPV